MKIAVWGLVIVGIFFVYQFTVGKAFKEYQACYDAAASTLATETITETNLCVLEKLTYEQMHECISTVQKESNFTSFLYQAAPAKKNIDADITIHNEACPSNKITPPKDSFYLSSGTKR